MRGLDDPLFPTYGRDFKSVFKNNCTIQNLFLLKALKDTKLHWSGSSKMGFFWKAKATC